MVNHLIIILIVATILNWISSIVYLLILGIYNWGSSLQNIIGLDLEIFQPTYLLADTLGEALSFRIISFRLCLHSTFLHLWKGLWRCWTLLLYRRPIFPGWRKVWPGRLFIQWFWRLGASGPHIWLFAQVLRARSYPGSWRGRLAGWRFSWISCLTLFGKGTRLLTILLAICHPILLIFASCCCSHYHNFDTILLKCKIICYFICIILCLKLKLFNFIILKYYLNYFKLF